MQLCIKVWSSMQCMVCCISWVILVMWFCVLHDQYKTNFLEEDKSVRSIQKSIIVLEDDKLKFNVFIDLGRFSYSFTTYFGDDIKLVVRAVKWWGIEKILGRDFGLGVSYSSRCLIVGSQSQHLSPALQNRFCCLFWIGQFLSGATCSALSNMGVDGMHSFFYMCNCFQVS